MADNKSDMISEEQVVDILETKEDEASLFFISVKENSNVNEMFLEFAIRMFPEFKQPLKLNHLVKNNS